MIELPNWAVPNGASGTLIDYGGFLTPALGGEVQRIDRPGNRFRWAFTLPPVQAKDRGRILVSRLIRAKTEGIRIEIPLLGFKPGAPGAPRVNGAGQAGRSLIVDGFTPNYAAKEGQWFNHVKEGRSYLYNMDGQTVADGSGVGTINFSPMLRAEPADNDVLEFAQPVVEGFVMGDEWSWEMSLDLHIEIQFEVVERA